MNVGNFANLPEELRLLPNWVLWRLEYPNGLSEKPTKKPYQLNGYGASSTDPKHWITFEIAFNALQLGGYDGLGFVFTNTDYSGIDLDDPALLKDGLPNPNYHSDLNRQIKIAHEFDSYSETSPSGKGLHIIVKGKVPDGRRTNYIELYPSGRFFTMTGKVHNDKPISDFQDLLTTLWSQMGGVINDSIPVSSQPETVSDKEILELARKHNTVTFDPLEAGIWVSSYPSQSEADQAYLNIISYYTNSREQVERIFRNSKLMRDKVNTNKKYLTTSINKAFDQKIPLINFDGLKEQFKAVSSNGKTAAFDAENVGSIPATVTSFNYNPPSGLMGEIAQFIYQASPRQAPEIAIAAAISLVAGICGRAYNTFTGTGLNMYVLVLAKTGRGKEGAASGIDKLMNIVRVSVPTATRFLGPGTINSGQALIKHLNQTSNCFVSVLGEFGITIDRISNPFANSADKMLYQALLDLYNKSGFGQSIKASIYSKKEDNVSATESPAVSIFGESTHKLFYGSLNEDMIAAGLLPRFLIIEYNGKREYLNEDCHLVQPSFQLVERVGALVAHCETVMSSGKVVTVPADEAATKMLRELDRSSTDSINLAQDDVIAELWNRAHMKVLRLSSLIAVGVNPYNPMVTAEIVQWSIDLVKNDIRTLSSRFEAGEIGKHTGETKQFKEIIRMIVDYHTKDWEYITKYSKEEKMFKAGVMPLTYFSKRLSGLAVFNDGRLKASLAINQGLTIMCERDILRLVSKPQSIKDFGTEQKCYYLNDRSLLD